MAGRGTAGESPHSINDDSDGEDRQSILVRAAQAVARLANRRPEPTRGEGSEYTGAETSELASPRGRTRRTTRRRSVLAGGILIDFVEEVDEDENEEDDETYLPSDEEAGEASGEETYHDAPSDEGGCSRKAVPSISGMETVTPSAAMLEHPIAQETSMQTAASPGSVQYGRTQASYGSRVNAFSMLEGRQINVSGVGRFSAAECCHMAQRFLPTDGPTVMDNTDSRAYIGQFAAEGSIFVAAYQDRRIRMYNVEHGWELRKEVIARNLRWTITDTALTPDQRFLVYASITPVVHLVNVGNGQGGVQSLANITDIHEGLDFSSGNRDRTFGLWSLEFSSDGREILAGSSDQSLYIYDLEANKPILRINAHDDDVNSVAFADESSHLIFSGSDDKLCKVWDRRALGNQSKPAGVLVGHCEGIAHLSSKGDGRHLITNSKDQTLKLWDLRKMRDHAAFKRLPRVRVPHFRWDYRWMEYPGRHKNIRHPHDQSLMTYRGHQVLQTLIRAYFSPMHTTGQRYIYTGSNDGKVYIYDLLTGAEVAKLHYHRAPVRDCSWHPTMPMLASVSWDGQLACWEHLRGEKPLPGPHKRRGSQLGSAGDAYEWED